MRKQNKKRLILILSLVAVVLVNFAAYLLPYRAGHPDVSGNGVYVLSDSSRQMLSGLSRDVEITYFAKSPDADLRSFLALYKSAHVRVTLEEPETDAADQTVRVSCGDRVRTLDLSDLYYYSSSKTGELLSLTEYAQISAYLSALDASSDQYQSLLYYYGPDVMQTYFAGDAVVSAAVRNLASDALQTVWVLVGEVGVSPDWYVALRLEQFGYQLQETDGFSDLPSGALLWFSPKADLSEAQALQLSSFLSGGGRLFLTTDYQKTNLPNLLSVLSDYGLSTATAKNWVVDGSSGTPTFNAIKANHAINESFTGNVTVSGAHAIKITALDGVSNAELLRTSLSGMYIEQVDKKKDDDKQDNEEQDDESQDDDKQDSTETKNESGCFSLAATAIRGDGRLVWIGMQFSAALDSYTSGKDSAYAASCLSWLGGSDGAMSPVGQAHQIPSTLLNVKVSTFSVWIVIFVALIPIALLVVALVLRYIRGKR